MWSATAIINSSMAGLSRREQDGSRRAPEHSRGVMRVKICNQRLAIRHSRVRGLPPVRIPIGRCSGRSLCYTADGSRGLIIRARRSSQPPAAKVTTIVTGRAGQFRAKPGAVAATSITAAAIILQIRMMSPATHTEGPIRLILVSR
jgi:hypothetical protein